MRAYCWSSGLIDFGRQLPKGALPIARGPERRVREIVSAIARHAYDNQSLLVPGIPEAPDQVKALEALERFIAQVAKRTEAGDRVTVFMRAHRWPVAGRGRRR